LDAITKRPGENYNDYLFRVKQNPLARAVKVLDITHNMDIRRIPNPTQKDRERVELKYGKALAYLLSE
ncbi:MAG TPA: GTP pyrophosphokinase, partial [Clostridia bacterium]|nr:GTP pyrophosphokinase [Clostridia bacterium]